MLLADSPIPELQTLSRAQYDLVEYALAGAGFALLAYTLYSWTSRDEVGVRYRPAVLAGLCLGAVATLSYLLLFLRWGSGFDLTDAGYVPNDQARLALSPRYVDWSVTVPLLVAELLAVCALAGARVRALRASAMTAAFLMILTGHLGAQVVDEGRDTTALVVWGLVSTAFYAYLYVALIGAVRSSMPAMGREAAVSLRNATIVLLASFGVYPLVYAVPVFVDVTAAWLTTIQLAYSAADVVAKVGFGVLVHKVAKLRTAEDVVAGVDTHPEAVWVSNVEHSSAALPPVRSGEERATPPVVGTGDPRRAGEHG